MICRQVIEVELAGTEADGLALQRKLSDVCANWLGPALDEMLERSAPPDEHWSIDRLVVEAGSFSIERLELDFVDVVIRAVRREIGERAAGLGGAVHRNEGAAAGDVARLTDGRLRALGTTVPGDFSKAIERRTDIEHRREAFLHFLATGMLPWWCQLPDGNTLEQWLRADDGRALLRAVRSPVMLTRLVRQFSASFLEALVGSFAPHIVLAVRAVLGEMKQLVLSPQAFRQRSERLWKVALLEAELGRIGTDPAAVAAWIRRLSEEGPDDAAISEARLRSPPRSQDVSAGHAEPVADGEIAREEGIARFDVEEGLHVECAGLVLLHPFLLRLFETLGMAEDGRLVEKDGALCLLHFLATGEGQAPEYALVLPKLLCGVPLEAPAAAPAELTAAEREEAIGLLEAVIGHWDALGSTSVDALRETFLVRPGKLSRRGEDDVLQVESRLFDILLDRLPWGIGTIRLPWMKKILWVEWTN